MTMERAESFEPLVIMSWTCKFVCSVHKLTRESLLAHALSSESMKLPQPFLETMACTRSRFPTTMQPLSLSFVPIAIQ
jgi:hypothetical protein